MRVKKREKEEESEKRRRTSVYLASKSLPRSSYHSNEVVYRPSAVPASLEGQNLAANVDENDENVKSGGGRVQGTA
jgi:phosphoribosylamine-glycine ligase